MTIRLRIPAVVACRRGASTIELAISLTALIGFLFGIINIGLVLWTFGSLYYAAEAAARCASVDSTSCGNATAIQNYALAQYYGQSLGGTNPFSYSASGCGHTVTARYTYSLSIPLYGSYTLPLSAAACFP